MYVLIYIYTQLPCMELQYTGQMKFQYGTVSSHKTLNFVVFLFRENCLVYLTNTIERGPSLEGNCDSVNQEIARTSWNRIIHYHFHKSM